MEHLETLPYGLVNNPIMPAFHRCLCIIDLYGLRKYLERPTGSFFFENMLSCFRIQEELTKELDCIESQIEINKKPVYFVNDINGKAKDFIIKAYLANKEIIDILYFFFSQGSKNEPKALYSKTIEWAKKNNYIELSKYLDEISSSASLIMQVVMYRFRIEHQKKDQDPVLISNIKYRPTFNPPTWDLLGSQTYILEDMNKVIKFFIEVYEKILQFGVHYYKNLEPKIKP